MKLLDSKRILLTAFVAATLWGAGVAAARADYASEVLALRPLTYWRFDDTGTFSFAATNLGTEGSNSGLYSDPTYMQGQPGALAGSSNASARFDGAMSKIDVPFDAALNPASFTVECWASVQGMAGNYRSPVSSRESASGALAGYIFYAGAGNTWEFWTGNGTGWNTLATTAAEGGSVVIGAWTHLVGSYDATNMTMSFYINGALILQETNITYAPVGTVGSQRPLRVGAGATEGPGAYWFDGGVDEVAVYPTVLTPAQVASNYATGTTNGGAYAAQVLALQPALYLRLDDKSANPPARNLGSLGAAANGRYLEGLAPSATDLTSPSFAGFGSSNQGVVFNGTGQSVAIGYTNIPVPWTFTCWVNRQDAPGVSAVLMSSSAAGLKLEQYNATRDVGFTAYGVSDYTFNYGAPDGIWTQLAYVGTQDGTTLYVNGLATDTNAGIISLPMTSLGVVSGDLLSGTVGEVATFNQALLDGQIMTLYLAAVESNTPPVLDNNVPILIPAGTVYATLPFSLSIDVYGLPPLSYEWLQGSAIVGTNASYTVAAASAGSAGDYSVIVSNAYGAVTSAVLTIAVNPEVPAGIAQSPAPRAVYPGGTADFAVLTSGTAPISYQWMKGGTNIPGATNQTLVITNVGPSDAAIYSVGVSNVTGSAVSGGAALTLLIPKPGTYSEQIVTNGPVAYWRLNESSGTVAYDYAGGDDGTNSATVSLGVPGPASPPYPGFESNNTSYGFDGADTSVQAGSLGLAGPLTVSAWINPGTLTASSDVGIAGELKSWAFKLSTTSAGSTELRFTTPGILDHTTAGAGVAAGVWQHVAATFAPGTTSGAKFYLDGRLVGSFNASALTKGNSSFVIGDNQFSQFFNGDIDEVAVYNKVLSADTIASLYAAAAYGSNTAPFVTLNPASQTVASGSTVTLSGTFQGSLPIRYQWEHNGTPVPGATSATLSLTNVYFTDAGSWALTAANAAGSTNTGAATLAVMPPPTFANLTNGLVLHLSFEGGLLTDSSGNGNNGAAGGSPTFVPGRIGTNAVYVNTAAASSTFNYVYVDSSSTLAFDTNDSFSVSFWVKYSGLPNDLPMIGNAVNSTYQLGWVFTDDGGKIECSLVSTAGSGSYIQDPLAGSPVTDNDQWHNVVGIIDRGLQVATVYVDGALAGAWSIVGLGTMDYGNPIALGQDPTGVYAVDGAYTFDDVGMWNRALSSYEAVSIYSAGQVNQSFDVYGPVRLDFHQSGTSFDLSWQAGTLLQSTNVAGPYAPVTGATAPFYRTAPTSSSMFYRVKQ